jgi:MoaA/NifB/PqqE/SkfB family radical SAM enzyme
MTAGGDPAPPPARNRAHLSIELTTRCDSACRHCFARSGRQAEADLPLAVAGAICAEGLALGYRRLHLTGGEPLLWPALPALLGRALHGGYQSVFLNSNGLSLSEAAAKRLAAFAGLSVSISLQGFEALHDAVRGTGTYRRTALGIRRALEAGLPVTIFAVVGKTLLQQLPAFALDLTEKFHGIKRITLIQLIAGSAAGVGLQRDLLDPEDFLTLVRTVSALNLYGLAVDVLNDPLVNVAADLLQAPLVPRSRPLVRPGKVMIRADRSITLAHSTRRSFGTYAPGMLAAVLKKKSYRQAVAADTATCPQCRFRDHCRAHGLRHPSRGPRAGHPQAPYCQRVLACIDHQA